MVYLHLMKYYFEVYVIDLTHISCRFIHLLAPSSNRFSTTEVDQLLTEHLNTTQQPHFFHIYTQYKTSTMSEEGHKKKSKKSSSKSKSKPSSVEDAIEKKLREKKKKEQAAAAAEDALEAKIRAKQKAADGELDDDDGDRIEEGRSITNDKSMDKKPAARSSSKKSNKSKSSTGAAAPSGMMDTSSPLFAGGGGDVRNQPPPSLAEKQQPEVDPLRALEEQKKKNAKQINPRYAELSFGEDCQSGKSMDCAFWHWWLWELRLGWG